MRLIRFRISGFLVMCGDFKEILVMEEKLGGVPRIERAMDVFREAVNDCGFQDLGFSGDLFIWNGVLLWRYSLGTDWIECLWIRIGGVSFFV